ncbi:hypothetical protein MRX96_045645 [Rhipicephalus microplus]
MQETASLRSPQDDKCDRRYTTKSLHSEYSGSERSDSRRSPPSGGVVTGEAGASEARSHPSEDDARPSKRSWTNSSRRSSPTSMYDDESERRSSSGGCRILSDTRDQEKRRDSYVSRSADRNIPRRYKGVYEDARQRPRRDQNEADAQDRGGEETKMGRILPAAPAKSSNTHDAFSSKSTRRHGSMSTRSARGSFSPPRRTSLEMSKVTGESRTDRWRINQSPASPFDNSSLPWRTSSELPTTRDHLESSSGRKDWWRTNSSPVRDSRRRKSSDASGMRDNREPLEGWPSESPSSGGARRKSLSKAASLRNVCEENRPRGTKALTIEDEKEDAECRFCPPLSKICNRWWCAIGAPNIDNDGQGGYTEYSKFSWFRLWILCSVAAIVLLIPFSLIIMAYDAASWAHGEPKGKHGGQAGSYITFPTIKGLNIDWDHPGDDCDKGRGVIMRELMKACAARGQRVLVTLPPDARIVEQHYGMFLPVLHYVEYLIIGTHR